LYWTRRADDSSRQSTTDAINIIEGTFVEEVATKRAKYTPEVQFDFCTNKIC
jgi:hypothetical protein